MIKNCSKCKELGHHSPPLPHLQLGIGKGRKVLIIAESPAKNGWVVSGKAFYTKEGKLVPTGKRLNEYLNKFGLDVEKVSFTELAKCYIEDRKLLEKSGNNCFGHLKEQIICLKPGLVITLGVITQKVFSENYNTSTIIGTLYKIDDFKYLPLYHPSPASPFGHKRNLDSLNKLEADIKKIID